MSEARRAALGALLEADVDAKCGAATALFAALDRGMKIDPAAILEAPERPGRPMRPHLVPPSRLPARGLGSVEGRVALLHAVAHIELNAVDLALDAVVRFPGQPEAYYRDWIVVAADEARHFGWLATRLAELGARYGDLDAHDGLWAAAQATAHDLVARMALVPRVLEARGLDVTPGMVARLRTVGDEPSAQLLERILAEEVAHVAAGSRWFRAVCADRGLEPVDTFERLLREAPLGLAGPFNWGARGAGGFTPEDRAVLERVSAARRL